MYSIIILLFSCFLALTQALPSTIERDVSHADAISALVEREPDISAGGGLAVSACWTTLSCSFHQIEEMNMQTRLQFVRYLQSRFGPLNAADQFRAIQGVIRFFIDAGQGGPGTWVSSVNAGSVEAVQRGGAKALGIGTSDGGNPGSAKWAEFLTNLKNGRLNNRNDHDHDWSVADQAAAEYGKATAESTSLVGKATAQELRWYQFTQLFRKIMRNRSRVVGIIRIIFVLPNPSLASEAELFINFLTDVTNEKPTTVGSKIASGLAEFDISIAGGGMLALGIENFLADEKVLGVFLSKMYVAYKENK